MMEEKDTPKLSGDPDAGEERMKSGSIYWRYFWIGVIGAFVIALVRSGGGTLDGAPIIILLFPMFALPGGVIGLMIAFVQTRRNDGVHGLLYLFGGVVGGLIAVNIFGSQQFLVEVIIRGVVVGGSWARMGVYGNETAGVIKLEKA
jgi:hypothetical protein